MGGRLNIQTLLPVLLIILNIRQEQKYFGDFLETSFEIQFDCSNYVAYSIPKSYSNQYEDCLYSTFVSTQASQSRSSVTVSVRSDQYVFILTLLVSGDIHPCPGPVPRYPCVVCTKGVRSNSKAVSCDNCQLRLLEI